MHEAVSADRDADVRHVPAVGHEEHEITGPHVAGVDRLALGELLAHDPPEPPPVLGEDVLHEPAAVEP